MAQDFAAPSARMIEFYGKAERRKSDERFCTYDGEILLTAVRLCQGQTTNFRTPGDGRAVFTI